MTDKIENEAREAFVKSGKNLIVHYERMEDVEMMASAKAGEARRAHDFIRVDLPVMIKVAEGKNPREEDLTQRQRALLDLSPKDLEEHIKSNAGSARRILGWTAPFAKGENKHFVLDQETFTSALTRGLVKYAAEDQQAGFDHSKYSFNPESKISSDQINTILENEKRLMEWPQPGQKALIVGREEQAKTVEEIRISKSDESMVYYRQYRLEGEKDFLKPSQIMNPENPQHGYGAIMERAGRLYYVELQSVSGPIEPEHMSAREIVGVDKEFIKYIDRSLEEEDRAQQIPMQDRDLKWALNIASSKEESIGEFTYRSVDGPYDMAGPIIIQGSSWTSAPSDEESKWADKAIMQHLEKYEFPSRTIHEEIGKQRSVGENRFNEPKFETARHPQPMVSQGYGM